MRSVGPSVMWGFWFCPTPVSSWPQVCPQTTNIHIIKGPTETAAKAVAGREWSSFVVQTFVICGTFSNVRILILPAPVSNWPQVCPHTKKNLHLHICTLLKAPQKLSTVLVQTCENCEAFSNVRVLILSGSRFKLAPVCPHTSAHYWRPQRTRRQFSWLAD